MFDKIKSIVYYSYHTTCVFLTLAMTIYCVHKYLLDKDVSATGYESFNSNDDYIYPAITLCIDPHFSEIALNDIESGINASFYKDFLDGFVWEDNLYRIDYDNVTLRFEKYILGGYISSFWTSDGYYEYLFNPYNYKPFSPPKSYGNSNWLNFAPRFYISFRDSEEKCFTIDIPNKLRTKIHKVAILLDASMLQSENNGKGYGLRIEIHYPNQYHSSTMSKTSWKGLYAKNDFTIHFEIQNIIIVNLRNKRKRYCNENWKNDDFITKSKFLRKVGCRPPHWKEFSNQPNCSNKDQMYKFAWMNLEQETRPCRKVQKVIYSYEELDFMKPDLLMIPRKENERLFKLSIDFDNSMFMDINHIRAFDIETLIGNAGGYLGLFTGYALSQLPQFIKYLLKSGYRLCKRPKIYSSEIENDIV